MLKSLMNQIDLKATLTTFGLILTLVIFWRNKRGTHKALTYDYSIAPFTQYNHKFSKALQITFNDQPVSAVNLVTITVRNAGSVPIRRDDFDVPVIFHFEGFEVPPRVLSAEVSKRKPTTLKPEITTAQTTVTIEPLLLNRGDSFGVFSLVEGAVDDITVAGRVIGIARISRSTIDSKVPLIDSVSLILLTAASLSLVISGWRDDDFRFWIGGWAGLTIIMLGCAVKSVVSSFRRYFSKEA